MRRKAKFRSNSGAAPMQQFAAVQAGVSATVPNAVYMPLHGFTAVDLGYQRGNAVSNIINKDVARNNTPVCSKELGCDARRKTRGLVLPARRSNAPRRVASGSIGCVALSLIR